MSRYTGPRVKVLRALGLDLPGLSRKSMQERTQPPGQHGARKMASKKSEFGRQLLEKQKLRYNYGLSETQFRRVVAEAKKGRAATGEKLIELLERRLDNLVFRAGFAPTIPAARQLVAHGHFLLNGRRVTIPSIRLRLGDSLAPRQASRNLDIIKSTLAEPSLTRPEWLAYDEAAQSARLSQLPGVDAVPFPVDLQLVVEYYATRM